MSNEHDLFDDDYHEVIRRYDGTIVRHYVAPTALQAPYKNDIEYKSAKNRAHYLFDRAVRRGKIIRQYVCERCGRESRETLGIHAHHEDYRKPLEVVWLCASCHAKRHGELNRARFVSGIFG